ncbi:hypothetical protein A3H85_00160 [Candidatus Daviesbacteria bacterium RIFCSPLOWO2_02_FULL_40_8]|uniref:Uncharacterized protein n=1 Tax=Candidatus Daviesbacteria bacterium RIFCSPLOWO2_01_FULL_40_24 TaxID=1797787 RepID=A0A1F5MJW8_9BACT|nr:MAG: hypothetical protein A2780_01320 [Candidatus Daviesbacteria bacterium RIFCSPHIGHO2_01_FULL_41_45]OGE35499.1 MAG: hypothetical protein A3C32_03560 [Candidatus Daviesbacteria bacterium RIFCSPHIGHO2_02_FULL_41_14]OGE65590.1 MAG: hypothetical protein A3B49_02135 [Candidatus Daviesbacteria bacterium RIFCSPLOWO2_01_FULL_40_24]OGE66521.1 MAG: hypothetical protein A3H85_00160 [Candidatus Daviesbacteria bacterium RIFCSPLOWO2_02_FULL_40_8]
MKQEYLLIVVAGLLILAYILDAVTNPLALSLPLANPYDFFNLKYLTLYSFTTTSVVFKSIAFFIVPLWFLSFLALSKLTKGAILLVVSALMQLYALQDVATGSQIIPLEWSLALTLAGMVLLLPTTLFLIVGLGKKFHQTFIKDDSFIKDETEQPT